jgi:hypothetical protein
LPPGDPRRFNGAVVVELLNPSAQVDLGVTGLCLEATI